MGTIAKRLLLTGTVQNVTFRAFAKQNANKLGLVGYARNLKNGGLEIFVQGDPRKVEDFIKLCKRGPLFAKVEDFKAFELELDTEIEFFDIRF